MKLRLVPLILLAWCNMAQAATVTAADYDSFWLWAGVRPQPALAHAKQIYLLQGEVSDVGPIRLLSQRAALPRINRADVWMVVRANTLAWTPQVYAQVLTQIDRWRATGTRVVGLQVDFDAGTRHLGDYAQFLGQLRGRLPPDYRLGITGLLDWSANGDPEQLQKLAGVVDEVVLQIYQGRHVIPGYERYLARLGDLRVPFRIGLLQDGEWSPPRDLETMKMFSGYVVFLQNRPTG